MSLQASLFLQYSGLTFLLPGIKLRWSRWLTLKSLNSNALLLPRVLREQYLKECISGSGILDTNKGFTFNASHPLKKILHITAYWERGSSSYTQSPWLISVSLELNVLHSCKSCGERLNQGVTRLVKPQLPDSWRHRVAAAGTSRLLPWFLPRQPRGQPRQSWRPCPQPLEGLRAAWVSATPAGPGGSETAGGLMLPPLGHLLSQLRSALSVYHLVPRPKTLPKRLGRGRPWSLGLGGEWPSPQGRLPFRPPQLRTGNGCANERGQQPPPPGFWGWCPRPSPTWRSKLPPRFPGPQPGQKTTRFTP